MKTNIIGFRDAIYRDSTPLLSVGNSAFEDWFQAHENACTGDKQLARDAYAAGMGDPLVTYAKVPMVAPIYVEPTQAELDAFILRAGFSYGWKNLDSNARRMAEKAVEELAALQAERDAAKALHHDCCGQLRVTLSERDALRADADHARACRDNGVKILSGIHSLLYPKPFATPDGRTMVFRPKNPDPHEVLQELSDRIRAIPDDILAADAVSEVVVTTTPDGRIVAVTRQDAEGRILSVLAEAKPTLNAGNFYNLVCHALMDVHDPESCRYRLRDIAEKLAKLMP